MFKNLEEVLVYLGNQTGLFKPIGDEISRLKDENIDVKKTLEALTATMLRG